MAYKPNATRTGVYQFEHCNANTALGSSPFSVRRYFMITQRPSRFRVHFRNYNFLGNSGSTYNPINASGNLTGFISYIGNAAMDSVGDPTGAFTSTPVQIQTSTTVTGGTELITGWISPSTFQILPYRKYILSAGFVVGSGVEVSNGGGLQWYSYTAADAGVTSPTIVRADNQGFLDIYIEYEFADDLTPIIAVVGNSLCGGGNVAAVANRSELDAFHGQWALANKGIVASYAVGGSWCSQFPATNTKWNHYDTLNGGTAALDVDAVLFVGTSSSDVAGGTAVATAKTDLAATVLKTQAMFPNARTILSTLPPRVASTAGTLENNRIAMNTWLSTSPIGADQCMDLEPLLTDGASPARLHALVNSGDNEHWGPRGHSRVSQIVPVTRGA